MRGSCVTNASPRGLRSCMEDEGLRSRLSGAGFKPPQAASLKSRCRERWGKRYRSGVDHGDERERTTDDVSKHFLATSKPGALLGQGWGVPDDGPTGVRHAGGVIRASMRNVRTCRSDVKGAGQAGSPCKSTKAEHRGGVARSSEEGHLVRNPGMVPNETICGVRRFHRVVFQRCVRCPPILHESFKNLK